MSEVYAIRAVWNAYGMRMATKTLAVQTQVVAKMCDSESTAALLEVKEAMVRASGRLQATLDKEGARLDKLA